MVKAVKPSARRVLLVEEHPMVRAPLAALINAEHDFLVCGEAGGRTEALDVARVSSPDLALVGLKLRHSHGLDLIKDLRLQRSSLAVIVLSTFDGNNWVERSLRAGARGFVSQKQEPADLLAAMRQVLAGEFYVNGSVVQRLARTLSARAGTPNQLDDLSDREYQVLWYIGHGYPLREIAEHLRVSVPTIETYRTRLKEKLGCHDQADLLKCAIQWAHSAAAQ